MYVLTSQKIKILSPAHEMIKMSKGSEKSTHKHTKTSKICITKIDDLSLDPNTVTLEPF